MFGQKIQSLQQRIIELEQQQAKYKTLEQETNAVLASIAKLHQASAELNEQTEIEKMIAQAIGYSLEAPQESTPEPEPETYEEIVERVAAEFEDECNLSQILEVDPPNEDVLEQCIRKATGTTTIEITATLIEAEVEPEPEPEVFDDKYSTPEELKAALAVEDSETILMEIANILDAAPATEIQGRVWYFTQNLPVELCDRAIPYLPKSIIPEWRKQMDVVAEEAKASIFPTEAPTTYEYEPEKNDIVEYKINGLVGRVVHLNDSPNGRMASVLLPGGTSNFHIQNLRFVGKYQEEEPTATTSQPPQDETPTTEDPEIDQLAKQCLGLRSWSQIRIFCDSNPGVILRMQEIASTKAEKRIINNLPSLVIGYIQRAGDHSDLQWLPEPVLSEVESLLAQPQVTAIA
jgi:hypothetical protein